MSGGAGAAERRDAGAAGAEAGRAGLERIVRERLGLEAGRLEVRADGREGEIAVIRVPTGVLADLLRPEVRAELVERARAAGFRHVAIDLDFAGALPARSGD